MQPYVRTYIGTYVCIHASKYFQTQIFGKINRFRKDDVLEDRESLKRNFFVVLAWIDRPIEDVIYFYGYKFI